MFAEKIARAALIGVVLGASLSQSLVPARAESWDQTQRRLARESQQHYLYQKENQDREIRRLGGDPTASTGVSPAGAIALAGAFLFATWLFSKPSPKSVVR